MSEAWGNAASIARAFSIGKFEPQAIHNLQTKVVAEGVTALKAAVRARGMRGFLQHEAVARDVFNTGFTSGTGGLEVWASTLMNKDDGELVPCTEHLLDATSKFVGCNAN